MPLATIMAREMRWKFFEVDQALEMLRVLLVTILAREMRLKLFQVAQRLETLRVPLVMILAQEMQLKVFSTISRANNVTFEIGARLLFFMLLKKVLFFAICIYLHTSFARLKHLAMQTCFYHLSPYIFQ